MNKFSETFWIGNVIIWNYLTKNRKYLEIQNKIENKFALCFEFWVKYENIWCCCVEFLSCRCQKNSKGYRSLIRASLISEACAPARALASSVAQLEVFLERTSFSKCRSETWMTSCARAPASSASFSAFMIKPEFTTVPLGAYSAQAFWIVAVLFASEHGPFWEVGLLCGVIYNWWMVKTKSLGDLILTHAVTNLCLSVFTIVTKQWQYWQ